MVWARGDLNFVGADLRTVHNMNVKQGVVLQELIAKELTVADALEAVCAQCDGGELTTREKRMLRDIKACGRALTTIAAEQGEQFFFPICYHVFFGWGHRGGIAFFFMYYHIFFVCSISVCSRATCYRIFCSTFENCGLHNLQTKLEHLDVSCNSHATLCKSDPNHLNTLNQSDCSTAKFCWFSICYHIFLACTIRGGIAFFFVCDFFPL